MRKNRARLSAAFLIFFLFVSFIYAGNTIADNQKNFLWKVRSQAGTIYILGSVHYFKKEMYPLNKKIEEAFDKSNTLVVEANINETSQADIQKLMSSAIYQGNDVLERHISKETYELIKTKFEELRMPLEIVNKQKPWFLALTLTALELVKLGFDPNYGIDRHFLTKTAGKKKIAELENIDYQIKLFSGFSDNEQEMLLLYTLKDLKIMSQEIDKLIRVWTSGDAEGMESIISKSLLEDKKLYSIYEKLIYERNRKMFSKLEEFLKTKDTYFVVIGAGHLVGKKGIIELLRAKGYTVEQL